VLGGEFVVVLERRTNVESGVGSATSVSSDKQIGKAVRKKRGRRVVWRSGIFVFSSGIVIVVVVAVMRGEGDVPYED